MQSDLIWQKFVVCFWGGYSKYLAIFKGLFIICQKFEPYLAKNIRLDELQCYKRPILKINLAISSHWLSLKSTAN